MPKNLNQFQTIRTEGALLPPDTLQRIAALKVDGSRPADYHLPPGAKLSEAISQAWRVVRSHWQAFQTARADLPADDTGTGLTNERWLLPLFKELDYGRLVTVKAPEIEERLYPIERFYHHTPIHLIGCNLPLDRRTSGARGAATSSPHAMVQEFLNRSDEHLWAFLSNGLQLRILRDNVSLSRQAYVEFDLEAMLTGEVYADFAVLWLLCHQSRIEADQPEDCWLEKWSHLAREQGTRVLNDLRNGVTRAIEALGQGFISHPRNSQLRAKLQASGELSKEEFYRQLLRIVYRLLFLFVAEDRELLHTPGASGTARDLYDRSYSTRRLRDLALRIRGSQHTDLWHGLALVFQLLGREEGCPELGLAGLGSFLWGRDSTRDLPGPHPRPDAEATEPVTEPVYITNDDLLQAVRALAYVEQDRVLRSVDYRNLGSEELGSVYESLLELHPVMHVEARSFSLSTAAGNERKTTGSYYTPDALVQCLLDSALDPVVTDRLRGRRGQEAEQALLGLAVCDPACGSGHFLIAAAHRLARHLARVRTDEAEPSPQDYQHALRDVIGHCIYGVDINPMSVELCKVSLWMESLEPGKPLSFLDHRIRCGNSLLGTTPELLEQGIPDEAFAPIEGDDEQFCREYRRRNNDEREGQEFFDFGDGDQPWARLGNLAASMVQLDAIEDDSLAGIRRKQEAYEQAVHSQGYLFNRLLADAWCAAFVWQKHRTDTVPYPVTEKVFRDIEQNPHSTPQWMRREVQRLAGQYQFFHWHLEFPEVFSPADADTGGFDCVLGNPPWERVKLQEKEFFAGLHDRIANAPNAAARRRMIQSLQTEDPLLHNAFLQARRTAEGVSHLLRHAGTFPLCGRGDVNTYTVFAETMRNTISPAGRSGIIVPSGIATDDTTKFFFQSLTTQQSLVSLFDFENRRGLFPDVDSRMRFSLLTMTGPGRPCAAAEFVFFAHETAELADPHRRFTLSAEDIELLNPNTRTCPIFRSRKDAELTKHIYRRVPVLIREASDDQPEANPWGIQFSTLFHMSNDSGLFRTRTELEAEGWELDGNIFRQGPTAYLPLYEAKMIHHFNHRFGDYADLPPGSRSTQLPDIPLARLQDPAYAILPRYWVAEEEVARALDKSGVVTHSQQTADSRQQTADSRQQTADSRQQTADSYYSTIRLIARATDLRTVITTVAPKYGLGHKAAIIQHRGDFSPCD